MNVNIMEKVTEECPREHARGNFRLLLSENETGINSMNAPIQLLVQGILRERCSADIRKRWKSKKKEDTGLQTYRLCQEPFF